MNLYVQLALFICLINESKDVTKSETSFMFSLLDESEHRDMLSVWGDTSSMGGDKAQWVI
jgi:hypothetical protein